MENPTKYIRDYVGMHYTGLQISPVKMQSRERVACVWGNIKIGKDQWSFNFILPRSAPEGGRPLCSMVKKNNVVVWEFENDHKLFQGLRQKFRVHLHELRVGKERHVLLVEVIEGNPDRITRVYKMDGEEMMFELETMLKLTLGKLWGMPAHFSRDEKSILDKLLKPHRR